MQLTTRDLNGVFFRKYVCKILPRSGVNEWMNKKNKKAGVGKDFFALELIN